MCGYWSDPQFKGKTEGTAEEWITVLSDLRKFMGPFHINFSGGEPLLRKDDLLEIARGARKIDVSVGFTTNGFLLDEQAVKELVTGNLFFNINISIDAADDLHSELRGVPAGWNKVHKGMELLSQAQREKGFPQNLVIKTVVHRQNIDQLERIVYLCNEMKFNGVNFQPIEPFGSVAAEMAKVDQDELDTAINKLIELKKEGYPILNSTRHLEMFKQRFRGGLRRLKKHCDIGFKSLRIAPDFNVTFGCFGIIGNLLQEPASSIWKSPTAKQVRKQIQECQKVCLQTCLVERNFFEQLAYGLKFLRVN